MWLTDTETRFSLNILLVEDDPMDVQLARIGLKNDNFLPDIHVVEDGEEAMQFLRKEGQFQRVSTPDIVLLDLNLPGMNGQEVLLEIKSDPSLRDIPVVVLTTSDAPPDIAKAYDGFANAYMTKPVDFSQFHRVVEDLSSELFTVIRLPQVSTKL
ncbi:MAG: response regulator [Actinomycetia bacterium]|nr:response regulator [Actinomycetes bacterium]